MKSVRRQANTEFVGLLNVMALASAVGAMFAAAACGQGRSASGSEQKRIAAIGAAQNQRFEQLYAEDADAWPRHDIAKAVSLFDPSCVFVAPDGKRTSYAEWRQNLPASLAQVRHSQVKTILKTVQVVDAEASTETLYCSTYCFNNAKGSSRFLSLASVKA